jgi:hypothetical protein
MKKKTQLKQFRERVYHSFEQCADGLMDVLDALSSQTNARSVVELSLEPTFQRSYHSLYRAIDGWSKTGEEERLEAVAEALLKPDKQPYWLLGTDTTSYPRQFARTLEDRGFVHAPNAVRGNKPVTIGHQYSVTASLPERNSGEPPWVVPLVSQRVRTQETESQVGLQQLVRLVEDEDLPWHNEFVVHVGDSRYSTPAFLYGAAQQENLVTISRLRSNRKLRRLPPPVEGKAGPGHPTWYGEKFKLNDPSTWHEPDEWVEFEYTSRRGKTYRVRIEVWNEMLMEGTREIPMHRLPFRLIRILWLDENGQPTHKQPIWLAVSGQRRHDLSLQQVQNAYSRRFDLEHFFRFGKQRLLLTRFQTPDVQREENWWQIVLLAYTQLWLARDLVITLPRPWERYLPIRDGYPASPSRVQRGFRRIIRQFGSPAAAPKPRGYSPGRPLGLQLPPRKRMAVVKKST